MEQGWSIDGRDQMAVHHADAEDIKVLMEMQNRSVTVMRYMRMVHQAPHVIRTILWTSR